MYIYKGFFIFKCCRLETVVNVGHKLRGVSCLMFSDNTNLKIEG